MTVAQRIPSTAMAVAFVITLGAGVPIDARAVDWPTFGFSNLRQGSNPNETTIGAANVASLIPKWSFDTQGVVTAQPVLAQGVVVNGTPRDLLIVGDNDGHLFALDANSTNPAGTVVWTTALGFLEPAPDACFDLPNNHFGIIGSPAISRTAGGGTVFVATNGSAYAFDLATGDPVWNPVARAIPNTNAAKGVYIYGAVTLAEADSSIYVATASACDFTPYHGQIAKFGTDGTFIWQWFTIGGLNSNGLDPKMVPTQNGGGIWGPGGVAFDAQAGTVFAATGNALPDGQPGESVDFAEDIVGLRPDLTDLKDPLLSDGQPPLQGNDVDFGATPLLFTANGCPSPAVVAVAKSGEIIVYWNRGDLTTQLQRIAITAKTDQLVGIPAWDDVTQLLFVTNPAKSATNTYKPGLLAFRVQGSGDSCQLVLAWQTAGKPNAPNIANFTYLSPPTAANGVVYFGVGGGYAPNGSGGKSPPNVYAISEQTGRVLWKTTNITGPVLTAPTVVNGRVFVGTFDNKIVAYGPPG